MRTVYDTYTATIEGHIALYCKPRPRWMPETLYRWLMSRVVLYEALPKWRVKP